MFGVSFQHATVCRLGSFELTSLSVAWFVRSEEHLRLSVARKRVQFGTKCLPRSVAEADH